MSYKFVTTAKELEKLNLPIPLDQVWFAIRQHTEERHSRLLVSTDGAVAFYHFFPKYNMVSVEYLGGDANSDMHALCTEVARRCRQESGWASCLTVLRVHTHEYESGVSDADAGFRHIYDIPENGEETCHVSSVSTWYRKLHAQDLMLLLFLTYKYVWCIADPWACAPFTYAMEQLITGPAHYRCTV